MPQVTIYTDGSARGNPGPGGYGVVMLAGQTQPAPSGRLRKELSQGYRLTTNNRMELLAVIVALEQLRFEGTEAVVITDSRYVADAVNQGWLFGWEKKGFKGKKNPDLWLRFLSVYRRHKVTFRWIRGHQGHPENERCDSLAVSAAQGKHLLEDSGYTE